METKEQKRAVIHKVVTKKDLEDDKLDLTTFILNLILRKKIHVSTNFRSQMETLIDINGFEFIAVDIQRNGVYEVVWVGGLK